MKKDAKVFIQHILECIERIEEYTRKLSKEEFANSPKTKDAVLRNLEVIGEATKNIPKEFREKYTEIPWQKIAGLRDVLIHGYFDIDLNITWDVVQKDLPDLKEKLKKILEEVEGDE